MTSKERLMMSFQNEKPDRLVDADFTKLNTAGNRQTTWITKYLAEKDEDIELILATFGKPDCVHRFLRILLDKKLRFIESMRGGGSASSSLISPDLHKEFCLPYDREMHAALHDAGFLITYHTCGGTRGLEDLEKLRVFAEAAKECVY